MNLFETRDSLQWKLGDVEKNVFRRNAPSRLYIAREAKIDRLCKISTMCG